MSPRPLFLYGSLMAPSLLAWAITGDPEKRDLVSSISVRARLEGPYMRSSLYGADYPALVHESQCPEGTKITEDVIGILFYPQDDNQRAKLDDFEGETYKPTSIIVIDESTGSQVDADAYMWDGDLDSITGQPWDFEEFVRDRLEDWLDIYCGMELVGNGE